MEERPPIWKVAANIFNKNSRNIANWWSSSLEFGPLANNASLLKRILLLSFNSLNLGRGLIIRYEQATKIHENLYVEC